MALPTPPSAVPGLMDQAYGTVRYCRGYDLLPDLVRPEALAHGRAWEGRTPDPGDRESRHLRR